MVVREDFFHVIKDVSAVSHLGDDSKREMDSGEKPLCGEEGRGNDREH